jgi:hypothetical protein
LDLKDINQSTWDLSVRNPNQEESEEGGDASRIFEVLQEVDKEGASLLSELESRVGAAQATLLEVLSRTISEEQLGDIALVEYGERVVRKHDSGTKYPVYGGGGATFSIDRFNRSDCFIVSRFGMSEECVRKVDGKFFLNDSGLSVRTKNEKVLLQAFLDRFLLANQPLIYSMGRGAAQKNLDIPSFREISVPLLAISDQQQVIDLYDEIDSLSMSLLDNAQERTAQIIEFRQAVLEAAFRGGI